MPEMPESRDTCILEAGCDEGIYIAVFDMDKLRRYREFEIHGNAYRHPLKYHILTKEKKNYPFIRPDFRK